MANCSYCDSRRLAGAALCVLLLVFLDAASTAKLKPNITRRVATMMIISLILAA